MSAILVNSPPRDTPFTDKRTGRISQPWLDWFGSITATATIVQTLQVSSVVAEDNSTDGNSSEILTQLQDMLALLAEPRPAAAPASDVDDLRAQFASVVENANAWRAEVDELRAMVSASVENANAWRGEVDDLRATLAASLENANAWRMEADELRAQIAGLDLFPGAQVAAMISSSAPATGNLTESTSDVLTITGGSGAVVGSGATIQVAKASSSQDGYLGKGDWSTFNGKQNALGYTALNSANNLSDVASVQTALNTLSGAPTSGYYLRGNGTNVLMAAIQSADLASVFAWTNYTPTFAPGGSMTISGLTITRATYCSIGNFCFVRMHVTFTAGGTASNVITISLPVTPHDGDVLTAVVQGPSAGNPAMALLGASGVTLYQGPNFAAYSAGSYTVDISGFYRV